VKSFYVAIKSINKTIHDQVRVCYKDYKNIVLDEKGEARGMDILWNPEEIILDQNFSIENTISAHF